MGAIGSLGVALSLVSLSSAFASPVLSGRMQTISQKIPGIVSRSINLGPADPSKVLYVSMNLEVPNMPALQAFDDSVNNPKSPSFHQYITPEQIGERFGQSPQKVSQVETYLESNGFHVTVVDKDNLHVDGHATVAMVDKAFGTSIDHFQAINPNEYGNHDFVAFDKPLQLPVEFANQVQFVGGLNTFIKPRPQILNPAQTQKLYGLQPLFSAGLSGQGRTCAISNWDGFRLSNVPLFYTQYNLPAPPGGAGSNITVETVDGGSGTGTPGAEGDIDIQMVLSTAPDCNLRIYDGGGDLIDVLTAEQSDNKVDTVSESYGWDFSGDEGQATACHNVHVEMSAQGITYMAASGDSGTASELSYAYSDYDPEVLIVGGTIAVTDSAGNRSSEVGWDGSGGGWALDNVPFNVLPAYQKGKGVPTNVNYRLVPDVSANAAGPNGSGAYYFFLNGTLNDGYEGTSFASPMFSGGLATAEQKMIQLGTLPVNGAGNRRLGRVQDVIYGQNGNANIWYDVTSGNNGTLPNGNSSDCTPGWDTVTGWGAINFGAFAAAFGSGVSGTSTFPTSVSIYQNQGKDAVGGVGDLDAVDQIYYSLSSVPLGRLGQVAGSVMNFTLSGPPSSLNSLAIELYANGSKFTTDFVYLYNYSTGTYNIIGSAAMNQTDRKMTFSVPNFASYVSASGDVQMLTRAVENPRFGNVPFTIQTDFAELLTN